MIYHCMNWAPCCAAISTPHAHDVEPSPCTCDTARRSPTPPAWRASIGVPSATTRQQPPTGEDLLVYVLQVLGASVARTADARNYTYLAPRQKCPGACCE
eukprot:2537085-Pyramimonas_sp.AAC.1